MPPDSPSTQPTTEDDGGLHGAETAADSRAEGLHEGSPRNEGPPGTAASHPGTPWQAYFSRGGNGAEPDSQSFVVIPGRWEQIALELPASWRGGELHLAPGEGFGLVDVAGIRLRTATLGTEIWQLLGGELTAAARVGGSAQVIPFTRMLRVLCAGPASRIILPLPEVLDHDEPLGLEIGLHHRVDPATLCQVFGPLAANLELARSSELRQQSDLRATRAVLAESQDRLADSELELEELRAAEEARRREEESSRAEITGLRDEVGGLINGRVVSDESLARVSRRLVEISGRLEEARQGWEEASRQLTENHQGWLETHGSLLAAQRGWKAAAGHLAEARQGWEESYQMWAEANGSLLDTRQSLAVAQRDGAESSRRLVEAAERLREKDAALAEAQASGEADHRRLRSMRRSASWRLTLPLRVIGRLLTGKKTAHQRGSAAVSNVETAARPLPAAPVLGLDASEPGKTPPPAARQPPAVGTGAHPPTPAAPPVRPKIEVPDLAPPAPALLALAQVPPAPSLAPLDQEPLPSGVDQRPDDGGYRFQLDEPTDWNLPTQQADVRGWCLPPDGSDEEPPFLRFRCGDLQTDVPCNSPREDVQAAYGGNPRWSHCGFNAVVDLPTGPSGIIVEAVAKSGRVRQVARFSGRTPYAARRRVIPPDPAFDYAAWVERYERLSVAERRQLRARARSLGYRPLISVVMPVYNAPEQWLCKAIDSVRRQLYPFWELCIADDASPQAHVREVLERYARLDGRIKVEFREQNGHISAASNTALGLARGEYVALLDHDDELPLHALYAVAARLNEQPGLQMLYSDEDKIDEEGRRSDPYFKPDWNYDLFLGQNMFSHLGVYRRDLLTRVGGFRAGLEGSQDYDLAIRCLDHVRPEEIGHLPQVLYHWRMIPGSAALAGDEKPYAREAARRAIAGHLARLGAGATVELNPWVPDFYRVRRPVPVPPPEVAIIIPTRDAVEVLRTCIESILRLTDYPAYRIVVVDNDSSDPGTRAYFDELKQRLPDRFQVLGYPGEFNFSALNNFAVKEAGAPLLCLLNNDIEVRDAEWLTELVSQAVRPEVGAAGARLLYPDGSLQHGGIIIGLGADRTAGHMHHGLPGAAYGYFGRTRLTQQFSAVTAACMVLRREVFEAAGGFNETDFPVALNDADLCLRLREQGYVIVWTPFAQLYHHESYSRGAPTGDSSAAVNARREVERFRQRHWRFIQHDPAYNPNLTLDRPDFSLSVPPRRPKF